MIEVFGKAFKLNTRGTSYVLSITDEGHAEHIYYGRRIPDTDFEALRLKDTVMLGTTVDYRKETVAYSLDVTPLEYSGIGKGDFRHAPMEVIFPVRVT